MSDPTLVLVALLTPMTLIAAVNLLAAPRLHRLPARAHGPRVSVLVPARDEAPNLRRLLPALLASEYGELEILVLDDESVDETAAVIRGFAASDPRVRVMAGAPPPDGWTGKNWACHQLAGSATGEVLLFCDADMVPGPRAVARTVAALERSRADALTALPRHERGGRFEQAVIPLVATVPVVALLPLPLVARTAKREGLRMAVYVASRDLAVRMYRDRASTREGFMKNLYLLAGGRPWTLAVALAVLLTAGLGPILLPIAAVGTGASSTVFIPLAGLAAVRLMAAVLVADHPNTVLLHPAGVLVVATLALESWGRHRRGTVAWKRRILKREEP